MAIIKIPNGLKLNRFEYSVTPHPRKLVTTFGYASSPASQYSGDENASRQLDKVHQIQEGARQYVESLNSEDNANKE